MTIGEIKKFELNHMPSCWIECNGQELSISEYPELFNAIGFIYGSGSLTTSESGSLTMDDSGSLIISESGSLNTFVLPDLRVFKTETDEFQINEITPDGEPYRKAHILYTLHA